MATGPPPQLTSFASIPSHTATGQPSYIDHTAAGPLIPAFQVLQIHQTYSPADQPGFRDFRQAGALPISNWAAQDFEDRQSSAGTPPKPVVHGRKKKALHYLRTLEGYGGYYMNLPVRDPRGIFCMHSVPCCSGPFDNAGQCISSRCGGCCSCQLPMPLARQE